MKLNKVVHKTAWKLDFIVNEKIPGNLPKKTGNMEFCQSEKWESCSIIVSCESYCKHLGVSVLDILLWKFLSNYV